MKNRFNFIRSGTLAACLFSVVAFSACDSMTPQGGAVRTSLQFGAVLPAGAARANLTADAGANLATEAAAGIVVEEVKLLVKSVKFHDGDREEVEFASGPFVVTIDPYATASTVAVHDIPPGTYDRVTFKIHKPEDHEAVPDSAFRSGSSGRERYSMIVRGSFNGLPFTLRMDESFQQRIALHPPLVVAEGDAAVNVTLLADISGWFIGKKGQLLNPLTDRKEIEKAIESSFRALSTKRGDKGGHGDDDDDDDNDDDREDD